MKRIALVLALAGTCILNFAATSPAVALETYEAQVAASDAASQARIDMITPWRPRPQARSIPVARRITGGLGARNYQPVGSARFFLRGSTLVAVSTISSGKPGRDTPTGIFSVLDKRPMYRSKKYDNAPMPWMQRIDQYGIALHAGFNPGTPASHGCVRLPSAFAKKLYSVTNVGTPVYIGA